MLADKLAEDLIEDPSTMICRSDNRGVAEAVRFIHIMGGEDNAHAFFAQLMDEIPWRQRSRSVRWWVIEENELRPIREARAMPSISAREVSGAWQIALSQIAPAFHDVV